MQVWTVIPAWNEARTIQSVVRAVSVHTAVLVVDDGSSDDTASQARAAGAVVVRHVVNRGLGAALGTGIAAAVSLGADIILTMDADGQHAPADVSAMLAPLLAGSADVVIGSRFLGTGEMPWRRRLMNHLANVLTAVLFGVVISDSQSGFRAFTRAAAEKIHIRTDRMEVSSEIVAEIFARRLRVVEVPIQVIYSAYSLSKGQGVAMGLQTFRRLLAYRIRSFFLTV